MALAPCRECETEVSTEADSCPHCGVRDPVPSLPSGKAPHGGPWDDWVKFQLRKRSPEQVLEVLVKHGAHEEAARSVVQEYEQEVQVQQRRVAKREKGRRKRWFGAAFSHVSGVVGLFLIVLGFGWIGYGLFQFAGVFGSGVIIDTVGIWAFTLYFTMPGIGVILFGGMLLLPVISQE